MCGVKKYNHNFFDISLRRRLNLIFSSLSLFLYEIDFFVVKELFMWMDECYKKKKTDGEETAAKVIAVDEEIYTK